MTALLERPVLEMLPHSDLAILQPILTAHTHMLETLDERREQLDELIADMMPIANAMLSMTTRALAPLASMDVGDGVEAAVEEIAGVGKGPAPGTVRLLARLRDPDVRKGMAMAIAALGILGRAMSENAKNGNQQPGRMT